MIKSFKAGGIGGTDAGAIASPKKGVDVSAQLFTDPLRTKARRASELEIERKKRLVGDEAVSNDIALNDAGSTGLPADAEPLVEMAQSSAGGTLTDVSPADSDMGPGFGEERVQALFAPGALGVNPLFAAVGVAAVSVTDNSGTSTLPATADNTQPGVSNISGVVIDGYIRGAKVFFDTDGDGEHDEDESFTITDNEGKYVLEVSQGVEGVIRAVGGTNINSDGTDGTPNTATLSAPLVRAENDLITLNITPITSLIEAFAQSEDGLAVSDASSRLASALGLAGVDLLTFDSILAETQSEDATQKTQALALNKIAAQVVSLINSVSTALQPDAANRGAVDSVVAQSVAQQVVARIINSESDGVASLSSILDTETLGLVVQNAVTAVMDSEAANGDTAVRDTAGIVAAAQGSASAQISAIDKATSAAAIAAEQFAVFSNKAPVAGTSQTVNVAENSKDVGTFDATDADDGDSIVYSLAGNDSVFFEIDSKSGNVKFKVGPDFEQLEGRPYQFTVLATDKAGASSTQQVTVNVTDVDEVAATEALMLQIAQLKKDLADSKTKQEAIQKAADEEITKLKAEVDVLTKSGLAKDGDLDAIKKQIAELEAKSALAAKDAEAKALDLGKQIEALQTSGKAKDADIAALKDELTKAKASAEVAQKALAAEVTMLKDEVSTLKVALAEREADIAQLKKDLADSKTKQEAIQKASEEEITKLKAEVEALTKSGLAKDGDLDAIKKQIAALEAKSALAAKDAEAKVLDLGKQIEALQTSGNAKDADIAALKDELTKAKASAEVAQKALAAEVTTLKDDVSTLKVALAEREEDVAVLKKIIEELGPQIDKVILGSTGNDTITNKTGENFIYGLSGNDTIVYNGFGELFNGGMVDLINGGPGVDTLRLIEANRTIEIGESWAKASGIEILHVAGTQENVNGFQAYLNSSAFEAGIRTIDLREIVALKDASLTSVVDGSNAASEQGLTIFGTSGNDLFTGGAGKDMLAAYNGADVYRGGAESDSIDLSEILPSRDRVVFEATGEFNGVDYIKGFATGLASSQADVLDLSAFVGSPAGLPVTLSDGTSGDIIRLLDLEGGQDITTAEGLQTALRSGGEYSNINIAANAKSIVVTAGSLDSGDSFVFMLTGDPLGMESAQLVAVLENVSLNAFTADNFAV